MTDTAAERVIDLSAATNLIREEARRLLEGDVVDVVLGYRVGWDGKSATPVFVKDAADVDQLIISEACTHNLAKYLVGPEGMLTSRLVMPESRPRVAIVAIPGAMRAIVGLMQEHQIKRESLVILGFSDGRPVGVDADVDLGILVQDQERSERLEEQIAELEALEPQERWAWWQAQFSKCIRCFACRQVCPFCYCEQCIAEQNQPQWIEKSVSTWNNRVWNTIRAFHLTGRCVDCGECNRACPVEIPLSLLNAKLIAEVDEAFGYAAGTDAEAPSALFSFRPEDPEGFIR